MTPATGRPTQRMWAACPYAKAVPGVRVAYTDEREEQHALDAGALVLVVPTVRSYEEAIKARDWAYFPPLGGAAMAAARPSRLYDNVPGGYRAHHQRQSGADPDDRDAGRPQGCRPHRQDPRRHRGVRGQRAIWAITPATSRAIPTMSARSTSSMTPRIKAGVRLCGPYAWLDRPDFTCFQAGSEAGAIAKGVSAELGKLANTQGQPEVGPWAKRTPQRAASAQ